MDASNFINLANVGAQVIIAIVAIVAVVASLRANKKQIIASEAQMTRQIEESRRVTTEERQHQSRPIVVPQKEISHNTVTYLNLETGISNESLYTSGHMINWSWSHEIKIKLYNMGNGPAFNLHCVLHGSMDICQSQFVSWNNGPIEGKSPIDVEFAHPSSEYCLSHTDSVDGQHPLYDTSLDSPSNPAVCRIACLTITYHDLFGIKHVSIFNYTLEHRWVYIAIDKIPLVKESVPLDLKELNDQKKQQTPKYSAPPILRREN